ncbi:hypothetical protein Hanom_Chr12g01166501 [Helianthus anomalus]
MFVPQKQNTIVHLRQIIHSCKNKGLKERKLVSRRFSLRLTRRKPPDETRRTAEAILIKKIKTIYIMKIIILSSSSDSSKSSKTHIKKT